ncbi:histidine kinase [Pseudonocardia sp. KRD291]|uniref:ATP-dependent DNA ligase n=1 Tax=Pseudonocardia sp. KRD291 TaxID=2792007 RepID=UPI001C49DF28|nr:histidine kinase [Pseudonocardia sp. KRD291]MBW0102465.1 histidine kinase [Pseudonocardia sp. KRD291]
MPDLVPPMLPTPGELAEATDPERWAVEFGWEGHRCVAYARPGRVRLLSSTARSVTGSFPELAALGEQAPKAGMVLDGTVVALDEAGRPSRRPLMRRTNTVRPDAALQAEVPVGYVVTDLLWADGRRILDLPYRQRRHELAELGLGGPTILVSPSFGLDEADLVMRTAEQYGLDGLHLKRLDVPYQPGRRTRNWLRVPLRRTRQVVVGGWLPAGRPDRIAAVLLGLPGPGGTTYVGRVGISTTHARDDVAALLDEPVVEASPFTGPVPDDVTAHARWLEPDLVALVEHRGRTSTGRLALPTWLGLVDPDDADPELWEPGPAVAARPGNGADAPAARDTPRETRSPEPVSAPAPGGPPEQAPWHGSLSRRLEQHFVYNTLNTIAALVRVDPPRARELLLGFADLSRAADRAGEPSISLADELGAVRAYLMIERTRFGSRLEATVDGGDDLADAPVPPLAVLAAVREAVQRWVEPEPDGGTVRVTTGPGHPGGTARCLVTAAPAGATEPVTVLALDLSGPRS